MISMLPIGGSSTPLLKSNAQTGHFTIDGQPHSRLDFVADLENIEVGVAKYTAAGPCFKMIAAADFVANQATFPEAPDDSWARAFRMKVKLSDSIANGAASVREWSSNSMLVGRAVNELYEAYWQGKDNHPGKLPVVRCSAFEKVTGKQGANFKPVLHIINWIDRPADLHPGATPAPASAPATPPAPADANRPEFT